MKKNDETIIKISDLSVNGEGIGRTGEGTVLFVKDTVPGDRVRVRVMKMKKTYGYARVMEILEASPDRVQPPCPIAGPCGGCQLQAMSYPCQLAFKEQKVRNNLERIGGFTVTVSQKDVSGQTAAEPDPSKQNPSVAEVSETGKTIAGKSTGGTEVSASDAILMEPILGMKQPLHYRNKAQYPVGRDKSGRLIAGFYAGRTHSIIESRDCLLGAETDRAVLDCILSHMEQYRIDPYDECTHTGLVRHILIRTGYFTGEILVCLILNGSRLPGEEKLAETLFALSGMTSFSINENRKRTNAILGETERIVRGRGYITDRIGDLTFRISAKSFFQVNPRQTERMYALALEYAGLTGKEIVWDLYCGAGTISLFLARKAAHVVGVEIVPEAIRDAKENARLNEIENVMFFAGKAEELVPRFFADTGKMPENAASQQEMPLARPDVIVVDPPRKGLDPSLIEVICDASPDRIVYVSCDSATLSRDLHLLCEGGYRVERLRPVDNFCQTVHVETVCLLTHKG